MGYHSTRGLITESSASQLHARARARLCMHPRRAELSVCEVETIASIETRCVNPDYRLLVD